MLIHNITKHKFSQFICSLIFPTQSLMLILLVTLIIFVYTSPLYCAGINTINKSLNKNEISFSVSEPIIKDSNENKIISPSKQIPKIFKNLSTAVKNSKSVVPPHGLYKFQTINIKKIPFVIKTPIPIKPSKIKKLPQSTKNKISKPLRIGAVQTSARIADNTDIPDPTNAIPMQLVFKEFPPDSSFPKKMNAEESEAVNLLKQMHKAIADGESENNVLSMYIKITQNYSSYQYLTALARFYFEECRLMRSNGYVYTGTAYYESYSQLSVMYSHEKTSKNSIYSFILQKCDERKKQIEDNNSQIEKEIRYIKWSLDPYFLNEAIRRIEAKEYTENPYYSDVPTEKTFWVQYNVYLENYRKLIKNYLLTKNFSEASKAMAEYEKFYANSIKRFHTVKYYKDNDTLLTKQLEIFRDTDEHLNFIRQYVALVSYQAEVNQANDLFKSEIEKYVNVMETYQKSMGNETTSSEKISDEKLELYKSHASSSSIHEQNTYYRNKINITFTIFTRSEGLYKYSDEIPEPHDTLKLWYVTDGAAPLHAFKTQIKAKSLTSCREKDSLLEFKSDSLAPYYCAKFIPNEDPTNNDKTKNLIKKHGNGDDKLKHTVCLADGMQYLQEYYSPWNSFYETNPFETFIETSDFFKNGVLGKGVIRHLDSDKIDVMPIRKPFLDKMGYEVINVSCNNQTTDFYVANQADWFVYIGHGDFSVGALILLDRNGNRYAQCAPVQPLTGSSPNDFFKTVNTNLDFLVLGGCDLVTSEVEFSPGLIWRKMFGSQTVILGYANKTFHRNSSYAISALIDYLDKNLTTIQYPYEDSFKNSIINKWAEINFKLSKITLSAYSQQYATSKEASAIWNKIFYTFKDRKRTLIIIADDETELTIEVEPDYELIEKDISSLL